MIDMLSHNAWIDGTPTIDESSRFSIDIKYLEIGY